MARRQRRYSGKVHGAVRQQVAALLTEAKQHLLAGRQALSRRKVRAARRAAMKVRLRLGEQPFCKACNISWVYGTTFTTRIRNKVRIRTCKACGALRRKQL